MSDEAELASDVFLASTLWQLWDKSISHKDHMLPTDISRVQIKFKAAADELNPQKLRETGS